MIDRKEFENIIKKLNKNKYYIKQSVKFDENKELYIYF